jgi:tight adherence protein C
MDAIRIALAQPGVLQLLVAAVALIAAFMLLVDWLAHVIAAVPPEDRAWRDPPPPWWRWTGWCARPVAAWIGPLLSRSMRMRLLDRLRRAGLEYALTVDQFVGGMVVAAMCLTILMLIAHAPLGLPGPAVLLLAAAAGAAMPWSWLRDRADRRTRRIETALPFYLDVITLAIEGGANLTGALQHAADSGPPGPMGEELQRVLRDVRAGRTRADALHALAERTRLPAMSSWISAVLTAERQGSSLGPILRAQAEQRRTERFLRAEELAMKAPVKMLFPLMTCVFPCTFLIVFFPVVTRLVNEGILG